jgi:hypothetical protein
LHAYKISLRDKPYYRLSHRLHGPAEIPAHSVPFRNPKAAIRINPAVRLRRSSRPDLCVSYFPLSNSYFPLPVQRDVDGITKRSHSARLHPTASTGQLWKRAITCENRFVAAFKLRNVGRRENFELVLLSQCQCARFLNINRRMRL